MTIELVTHTSIREIGQAEYERFLDADSPPFLRYAWLDALEETGCVRPERGWMPLHLSLYEAGERIAVAPAYIKGNSEGEFVFDHGWARFANAELGIPYYPKLIVAVPFTPATGPRLLVARGADARRAAHVFRAALGELCERLGCSGAHVLFADEAQAEQLEQAGLARRYGLQFHWRNDGYSDFDDFVARFNSKRRNQIRRERREIERQGTTIQIKTGPDLTPEVVDAIFDFYSDTVSKFYWGRQYLNRQFFEEVCSRMPDQIHVVLASDAASRRAIGGAFNLLGRRALYGRYWGAREQRPFLHFNVCYYTGIAECIARGLALFEPGAGGEHKLPRGFLPSLTHSAHFLADERLDRVVRDFVRRERHALREHVAEWNERPVLKPTNVG